MATLDTLQDSVNSLTASTTELVNEVQVKKATLDASVADAESARDQSQDARDTTLAYKNSAEAAAALASTYKDDVASAIVYQNLQAIAATKAVTAVDVFVYDTSKDSDGGAWRKRTQNTSWYNETLNTSTRGSRKEFPAVAVIVAESNKLTIYDGDDPSLPMWMVFLANFSYSSRLSLGAGGSFSSTVALNGAICLGSKGGPSNSGVNALFVLDFAADRATKRANNGFFVWSGGLGGANSDGSYAKIGDDDVTIVNDVAMTVLPDAPIDSATGLPVPTIRVGTDGGISVIENDGTVTSFASSIYTQSTSDNPDYDLWQRYLFGRSLLVGGSIYAYMSSSWYLAVKDRGGNYIDTWATGDSSEGAPVNQKFTQIAFDPTGNKNHMSCGMTASYCSGWMPSLIKGAFLSDTDDTDLVGSGELMTNGTFDADLSGWTLIGDGSLAWNASGAIDVTSTTGVVRASQSFTTVAGHYYKVSGELVVDPGNDYFQVGTSAGGGQLFSVNNGIAGLREGYFVATGTTTYISVGTFTGQTATFDNISVVEADADRSVNNNGLTINGTVTRDPVATGADLVAYSGFSASNYLEQPYNSDLDFGTGDFCVMGWVNLAAGAADYRWIIDGTDVADTEGFGWYTGPNGVVVFRTKSAAGISDTTGATTIEGAGWAFVCTTREATGTSQNVYINGKLDVSATVTARTISGTNAPVRIGTRLLNPASFFQGSLALLRISATAPTASQIAKIYNDEKVLFQENAQATLYGSSDAVTALAHDSDTNLLHVGTSAGRSVFQGLRRVSNTTTAVGTAISASNGLVVEE